MTNATYSLTGAESTALDLALASGPNSRFAKRIADQQQSLLGLTGDALTDAQAQIDRLMQHKNSLDQTAYGDVLATRAQPVALPSGWSITRLVVGGVDSLVLQS